MQEIAPRPAEVQVVYDSLSDETLAQLPERIRSRIAGDTSVAYNHHDYDCEIIVNNPWRSGSDVRAYAFWDCRAEARTSKTRLRLTCGRTWTTYPTLAVASGRHLDDGPDEDGSLSATEPDGAANREPRLIIGRLQPPLGPRQVRLLQRPD